MATPTMAARGVDAAAFEAFLAARDEPGWLVEQRREAWRLFQSLDWPDRRAEEWLRTDIRTFRLDSFSLPTSPAAATPPPALLAEGVDVAGNCVSLNGQPVSTRLDDQWRARGVVFGSLDQLAAEHGELVQRYLMTRAVQRDYDKFAALHAACWTGGTLLYVPRGVQVEQPLLSLSALSDGGVDLSHTLVILDEGAEATMLTETASVGPHDAGLHVGGIELFVLPGARLRYVSLQNWGAGVWHFAHQKAIIDRDAALQWTSGALGARLAKVNQHVELIAPGADCEVNGVMFTEDKQHLAYHTEQHHAAPNCRSDFLYKSALQDRSRTVWQGLIRVDHGAQQTNGYQRNDNLMLSDKARADSIPGLQINADDVRCTHGSTTGRVDEELIFYAQCRGFTRREATRMIVTGFFQQVFDRIPTDSVREALGRAIARRVREYD